MNQPVTLVTATASRGFDDDEEPLQTALREIGLDSRVAAWDDPEVDWGASALTVIRSTWDYTERHREFLAWALRVSSVTRLENPAPVLAWNTDKQYLADLDAAGVPIVPSTFFRPGDSVNLPYSGEVVVKPSVGAGSKDAGRFDTRDPEPALAHAATLLSEGRTVLVQPYQDAVDAMGETALLYFAGRYSHSINKGPLLVRRDPDDPSTWEPSQLLFAPENITPHEPSEVELQLGGSVIRRWPPCRPSGRTSTRRCTRVWTSCRPRTAGLGCWRSSSPNLRCSSTARTAPPSASRQHWPPSSEQGSRGELSSSRALTAREELSSTGVTPRVAN